MVFDALSSELSLDKRDYTRGLKSAAKETLSFGKTAEGTFEEVGDEAEEAGTKAGASSFGFRKLGETMKDTTIPSRLLAVSLDEVGDEASEAGRSAFGATTGFAALRISTTGLSLSLGALTTIGTSTTLMLGGLAVAAAAVSSAMLPVIVGATAIAAAFGVIIGSGIFAGMKRLKKAFAEARKSIEPMIKELGEQFVPFLLETIRMLPGLVKNIIAALGPLDQFLGALKTLRNAAFDLLPKFIKWWLDIGRWALPIIIDLGNWIVNSLAPALRRMIARGQRMYVTLQKLAPVFGKFVSMIKGAWNWLTKLIGKVTKAVGGNKKLRQEVNQLVAAGNRFWVSLQQVWQALQPLVQELIKLAPIIAKVAIDVATLALNIGAKLLPYLIPFINMLTRLVGWFNSLSPGIKQATFAILGIITVIGPMIVILGTVIGVLTSVFGTIMTVVGVLATLVTGIVTVIGIVGSFIIALNPLVLALLGIIATATAVYLAVTGQWKKLWQSTKWLVNKIVGFFEWLHYVLIGGSIIPKMLSSIIGAFRGWGRRLSNFVSDLLSGLRGTVDRWVGRFTQPFKDAANEIVDKFSWAKRVLVGNSIVPDMNDDMLSEAERFAGQFPRPFEAAADSVVGTMSQMAKDSTKAMSGMGEDLFKGIPKGIESTLKKYYKSGSVMSQGQWTPLSSITDMAGLVRHTRQYYGSQRNKKWFEDVPINAIQRITGHEEIRFDNPGGGQSSGPRQMTMQLDDDATERLMRGEAVTVFDERVDDLERKQKRRRGTR